MNIITRGIGLAQKIITRGFGKDKEEKKDWGNSPKRTKHYSIEIYTQIGKSDEIELNIYSQIQKENNKSIKIYSNVYKNSTQKINIIAKINHKKLFEIIDAI